MTLKTHSSCGGVSGWQRAKQVEEFCLQHVAEAAKDRDPFSCAQKLAASVLVAASVCKQGLTMNRSRAPMSTARRKAFSNLWYLQETGNMSPAEHSLAAAPDVVSEQMKPFSSHPKECQSFTREAFTLQGSFTGEASQTQTAKL